MTPSWVRRVPHTGQGVGPLRTRRVPRIASRLPAPSESKKRASIRRRRLPDPDALQEHYHPISWGCVCLGTTTQTKTNFFFRPTTHQVPRVVGDGKSAPTTKAGSKTPPSRACSSSTSPILQGPAAVTPDAAAMPNCPLFHCKCGRGLPSRPADKSRAGRAVRHTDVYPVRGANLVETLTFSSFCLGFLLLIDGSLGGGEQCRASRVRPSNAREHHRRAGEPPRRTQRLPSTSAHLRCTIEWRTGVSPTCDLDRIGVTTRRSPAPLHRPPSRSTSPRDGHAFLTNDSPFGIENPPDD